MEVGFFYWPFSVELTRGMAKAAERWGYDMVGVADTPGNAMDPWVSAALLAEHTQHPKIALCVTNLTSRHPAVSAAASASIDLLAGGRALIGIGAGNSGTRNLGLRGSKAAELKEGVEFLRMALSGQPATYQGATTHLPWVKRAPPVFQAASLPRSLEVAGEAADGVFANYGLDAASLAASTEFVARGARQAGRATSPDVWQISCLDCHEDREVARRKVGAILAFVSGYVIGTGNMAERGVPEQFVGPMQELRRRYSTRPGDADARMVEELGLFDYLAGRLAIWGNVEDCLAQALAAKKAGAKRLMFTVSLAADPVQTVNLFGEHVLPHLRAD